MNPIALRLGYAGLVPFVLGAVLVWLVHRDVQPYATLLLAGYGAVIVSFLGGVHWGLGMRQAVPSPASFTWGAACSLVAWVDPYAGDDWLESQRYPTTTLLWQSG